MAGLWYRVGTVSVTNGSKKVTGFGTKWKTSVAKPDKGHPVHAPDGRIYELDYVESDTVLWLVSSYAGPSAADQSYAIDITRTGTVPAFSRDLSAFVAYHQGQMDGWQQLLTGTGDVTLTAPDGTKKTVPSWEKVMNAGTGVVAQAKTEADRAKTEAQNAAASAAASAASAGNAVVAAALPLPDVWAPLSDSLRLITGYGREVLVGSDVVARMVNFSRNSTATYIGKDGVLKTAAANEPRFEKEGLLIEGQSTNFFPWSQFFIGKWTRTDGTLSPDANFPNAITLNNSIAGYVHTHAGNLAVGSAYTITAIVKGYVDGVTALKGVFANAVHDTMKVVGRYGNYTIISFTRSSAVNTNPVVTGISWDAGKVSGVVLCALQIEALPFSSSYIQTNGSSVTRAQDQLWMPAYGNAPVGLVMSIAAEVDILGKGLSSWPRLYELNDSENNGGYIAMDSGSLDGADVVCKKSTVSLRFSDRSYWSDGAKRPSQWNGYLNQMYTGNIYLFGTTNPARAFYGHVRNVRAWFSPLSDAQHKAIK